MKASMAARRLPLALPQRQRAALAALAHPSFDEVMQREGGGQLRAVLPQILQMNLGKLCNQTCRHCHVDAGPDRTEVMTREVMQSCLDLLDDSNITTVDLTGGAPELNPNFRWLVGQCRRRGRHVIDRCNLTVLLLPSQRDLIPFLAEHQVEVVCSLPHYRQLNTDKQRGDGVFEKSVRALQRLNHAGYGRGDPGRRLVLVTNPAGALLPAAQASLERDWKREMKRLHGVDFDALYALTNMPISRYLEWLTETDNLERYMQRLVESFNPAAAAGLMCRSTLSIGWEGTVYDCDFNQMLEMPVEGPQTHVAEVVLDELTERRIQTHQHCFGCMAGAGSSCGGNTVATPVK